MALEPGVLNGVVEELAGPSQPRIKVGVVAQVAILVPCHRVVCSSGAMGNYSGGMAVKEWLLAHEGSLAGKPARAGRSRPASTWRGALGGTASAQPAGRN
ncbi:Methylated-DNA--protein-cysteine methyltransferase [Camelus dromedarius]|uniref:Methylated-DNA--protein-cysteine methyltransferase n=1 Tax=Camelus dromedarius TaxID=9838 RepID=A0A5N4DHX5_CAMDR|nr:Methylated-DNA--protein-cysteine methyltransferase [Camelus dromedarius]